MNFLEPLDVRVGEQLDELLQRGVRQARRGGANTADNDERYALYAQMEEILLGPEGEVPFSPIYWYTYTNLERPNVQDSFNLNLLDQVDLTMVEVKA